MPTDLDALCDRLVPGSAAVGPSVYVEALIAGMPEDLQGFARASIDELATADDLAALAPTPGFQFIRALAIEAYYSDFVAPGREAPGAWKEIGFDWALTERQAKDWSFLGITGRRLDGGPQGAQVPALPAPERGS